MRSYLPVRLVLALLGLCSVAALLAWVFGLGSFAVWFWAFSAPCLVTLAVVGTIVARRDARVRAMLVAGTIGGLAGTIGYDLFRIPFVVAGMRLFAPIDSYGVLLLGAETSNAWTGLAGWGYHFANGIGFGIAYAMVALGRRWWWGIAWAMVLETATIVTPFAGQYQLAGQWGLIGIAYAAHVAYGWPLGRIVERGERFTSQLDEMSRRPTGWALLGLALVLVVWHRPFAPDPLVREGRDVAVGPSAVVVGERFVPEWLRIPARGCATLRNADDVAYPAATAVGSPTLEPGVPTEVCFAYEEGVHRVRLSDAPYSGGFVVVDPAHRR